MSLSFEMSNGQRATRDCFARIVAAYGASHDGSGELSGEFRKTVAAGDWLGLPESC
jgi:hypothetical protein